MEGGARPADNRGQLCCTPTPMGTHSGQAGYTGSPLCSLAVSSAPATLTLGPERGKSLPWRTLHLVEPGVGGPGVGCGARGPGQTSSAPGQMFWGGSSVLGYLPCPTPAAPPGKQEALAPALVAVPQMVGWVHPRRAGGPAWKWKESTLSLPPTDIPSPSLSHTLPTILASLLLSFKNSFRGPVPDYPQAGGGG